MIRRLHRHEHALRCSTCGTRCPCATPCGQIIRLDALRGDGPYVFVCVGCIERAFPNVGRAT